MSGKAIVKEGQGIIQDFLGTAIKKVNFKDHPFETIFGIVGPALAWKVFGAKISILMYLGEFIGFGPGRIGRLIDEHLNWSPGQSLSLDSLKSAARAVVDKIKGLIGIKASAMLTNMMEIKGTIDDHDLVAVAYINKCFPTETIEKQAIEKQAIGRRGYLRRFFSALRGGKKLGFANVLYAILKLFAGGLAGLGLVGVVGGLAKRHLGLGVPEAAPVGGPSIFGPSDKPEAAPSVPLGGNLYVVNEKGNVEDTLIHFLNSTIEGFSQAFAQVNKRPLKGSPAMRGRLAVIERLNGKKLWRLNREKSFVIPPIMIIANSLLPEAKYEKISGPAPAAKPTATKPTAAKPKGAPAKELKELLQGAK